jgi:uncharacterized protein
MKVYIDFTPHENFANECASDCGSPTVYSDIVPPFPALHTYYSFFFQQKLQQTKPLYTQLCSDSRWLVCCPTGTGRLAVLDEEAFALLERFGVPANPGEVIRACKEWSPTILQEVITLFYNLGFLQEESRSPAHLMADDAETLTAWLHVTNACNLRCSYCYIQKTQEHMQMETGYKSIDAIFRSALKRNIRRIQLKYAGGEASLHMSGVMALHDYALQLAQQHGITLSATLLSNGVVFSESAMQNLLAREINILISLDGIGTAHDSQRMFPNGQGSFKYVQRTIARLKEKGLRPSISVTVSQRNLAGLPELMRYLLAEELRFSLNYYREHSSVRSGQHLRFEDQAMIEAIRAALEVIEERLPRYSLLSSLLDKAAAEGSRTHTCGVGRNYLVIDQHGGVAKCQAEMGRQVTTVEHADPLQALREDATGVQNLAVDEKEGCRSCDWRYWCTGGCPLLTYEVTGRNDVRSPNCNIYKALFPDVLRLEALRLLAYQTPLVYENVVFNV